MKFLYLEEMHRKWRDVLVIGKTIERDNRKYHIVGMTLAEEAKLYIIEPYSEPVHERYKRKGVRNQRRIQREQEESEICYLHCSDVYLGNQRLQVQGGSGGCLKYSEQLGSEEIQLFFDMMSAGWVVPEWLKHVEWDSLQLVALNISGLKKLPKYTPEMAVTIKHRPNPVRHILEKNVTLSVGKSRTVSFTDHCGDTVQCYINAVTLMDVWKETEEQFKDPRYAERFSPEQLQEAKSGFYAALEQSCPKGMCYIGIEYECSKDMSLQFYSKQFLQSRPEHHTGSATAVLMTLKPDQKTGTHNLPLKGCVVQTAVSPDTAKIPAELFCYYEKAKAWEETV